MSLPCVEKKMVGAGHTPRVRTHLEPINVYALLRDMDCTRCQWTTSGGFLDEVPMPNNQNPLARSHQELRGRSANAEVAARTGLGRVSDLITRRRNSVFGHIARLSEHMPAHQALWCHVDLTLGHLLDQTWKVAQAIPTIDGLTSYTGTTTRQQLTCGEDPPQMVIRKWRYGPRRLYALKTTTISRGFYPRGSMCYGKFISFSP